MCGSGRKSAEAEAGHARNGERNMALLCNNKLLLQFKPSHETIYRYELFHIAFKHRKKAKQNLACEHVWKEILYK